MALELDFFFKGKKSHLDSAPGTLEAEGHLIHGDCQARVGLEQDANSTEPHEFLPWPRLPARWRVAALPYLQPSSPTFLHSPGLQPRGLPVTGQGGLWRLNNGRERPGSRPVPAGQCITHPGPPVRRSSPQLPPHFINKETRLRRVQATETQAEGPRTPGPSAAPAKDLSLNSDPRVNWIFTVVIGCSS